jgi:F-type H+-transporting ATPase subunit b
MLDPNWGLIPWTLLTFGLSVFVLWKYAFGPLQRAIDGRRARIQESLDTAEQTRAEAQDLLEEYKKTLAEVRSEAEAIVERARLAGDTAKAEMVDEARRQSERIVEKAHEQVERDTRSALRALRSEVAELTALATEKVTVRSLSAEDHQRLVDDALREIDLDGLGAGPGR